MKEANLKVKEHLFHAVCFHARLLNHNGHHIIVFLMILVIMNLILVMIMVMILVMIINHQNTIIKHQDLFDEGVGQTLPFCFVHVHQLLISVNVQFYTFM